MRPAAGWLRLAACRRTCSPAPFALSRLTTSCSRMPTPPHTHCWTPSRTWPIRISRNSPCTGPSGAGRRGCAMHVLPTVDGLPAQPVEHLVLEVAERSAVRQPVRGQGPLARELPHVVDVE